jgi:hypothetical protein
MSEPLRIPPLFARRTNADGSIDSICRKCYITVASATRESDLVCFEREHICDPDWSHCSENLSPGRPRR